MCGTVFADKLPQLKGKITQQQHNWAHNSPTRFYDYLMCPFNDRLQTRTVSVLFLYVQRFIIIQKQAADGIQMTHTHGINHARLLQIGLGQQILPIS